MESSASAGRVASAVLDPRRWWALALLCGAFFMVLLDGTITIVALPPIGAGLRFSGQGLQWVLSAYALTFGGLLLLGGRAADLLGRRRVFMAGAVFFTTASRPRRGAHHHRRAGPARLRGCRRTRRRLGRRADDPAGSAVLVPEPDPAADADAAAAGDVVIRSGTK
jgi:Major Facilitator Superfamily